jgi:hypothetical protein
MNTLWAFILSTQEVNSKIVVRNLKFQQIIACGRAFSPLLFRDDLMSSGTEVQPDVVRCSQL